MKLKNGSNGNNGNGDLKTLPVPIVPNVGSREKRMVLSAIKKSSNGLPEKIVLYGSEGWGKTTWSSKAENPIFISTEGGLKAVTVDSFPEPKSWQDVFDAIDTLRIEKHDYKTLVIDTADWTEMLCQSFLLERDKKQSIEDYGYGKGYVLSFEEWKKLLLPLDNLRSEKNMDIIFLAHSQIKTFNNPAGENWDKFEMKLDRRISALLKEWADCVLFGNYDVAVDIKKGQSKGKGYGGDRVIYTTHSPAWDAKNRSSLPEVLSSDPKEFWTKIKEVK